VIYFTTDTHFCHDREFIYKERGFDSILQHDYILLQTICKTVKADDILWVLGDISWDDPVYYINLIAEECNVNVVTGNHDQQLINDKNKLYKNVKLFTGFVNTKFEGQKVTLSHFPLLNWEKSHYNSWQLYGHLHNKQIPIDGKLFDVCPTKDHLQPYSWDEIKIIMNSKLNNWDYIER